MLAIILVPIKPWSAASTSVMGFDLLMFHTIRTRQLCLAISRSVSCVGLVAVDVRSSLSINTWDLIIFSRCSSEVPVMNA